MKLRKIIIFILVLFSAGACKAQFYTFENALGDAGDDYGYFVQQVLPDSGYIIAGHTFSFGGGNSDMYLIRTKPNGDTVWAKSYGGSLYEYGYCVQQTLDGGFIVAGITSTFDLMEGDVAGTGNSDIYIVKTNSNGDTLWTRVYGGSGYDQAYSIRQTSDNGYIVAGFTSTYGAGWWDIYLIKLNQSGDTLWTKVFGGSGFDNAYSVIQTRDHGYAVCGFTDSYGAGNGDAFALKTDSAGSLLWFNTYGGNGPDGGNAIQQTSDTGFVITGYNGSFSLGNYDMYLIKTDAKGDTLWTKAYVSSGNDFGNYVMQTPDTGYVVIGYDGIGSGTGNVYMIKTNKTGDTLWTRTMGGNADNYGSCVQHTMDGGYAILGFSNSFGAGGYDLYFIKTDPDGNTVCNQYIHSSVSNVFAPSDQVANILPQIAGGGLKNNMITNINGTVTKTDLCQGSVGIIPAEETRSMESFPNPFTGSSTLFIHNCHEKAQIRIFDMLGNLVRTLETNDGKAEIRREHISPGVYFCKVFVHGIPVASLKLVAY